MSTAGSMCLSWIFYYMSVIDYWIIISLTIEDKIIYLISLNQCNVYTMLQYMI